MKPGTLYSKLLSLLLVVAGCFMYGCTPDKEGDKVSPLKTSKTSEVAVNLNGEVCLTCSGELPIYKGSGGALTELGGFEVCISGENLCFYYAASGGKINKVKIGLYESLTDIYDGNVNPSPKNFQKIVDYAGAGVPNNYADPICIPLVDVATALGTTVDGLKGNTIVISTNVQISGSKNSVGGQGWVGEFVDNGQYPFERYIEFKICDNGGNGGNGNHCLFTQGYWHAKPNSVWPGCMDAVEENRVYTCGSVTIGDQSYTRAFLRDVFFSTNQYGKTSLKQAFLQASALQLNLDYDAGLKNVLSTQCLTALATINNYFKTTYPNGVTMTDLNRDTSKSKDKKILALQAAADQISTCLNSSDYCNRD